MDPIDQFEAIAVVEGIDRAMELAPVARFITLAASHNKSLENGSPFESFAEILIAEREAQIHKRRQQHAWREQRNQSTCKDFLELLSPIASSLMEPGQHHYLNFLRIPAVRPLWQKYLFQVPAFKRIAMHYEGAFPQDPFHFASLYFFDAITMLAGYESSRNAGAIGLEEVFDGIQEIAVTLCQAMDRAPGVAMNNHLDGLA